MHINIHLERPINFSSRRFIFTNLDIILFLSAVKNSKTSPEYNERMKASVRDYLDENGLDDMAALAKKYDVSKSSILRYIYSCSNFMSDILLTTFFFHRHVAAYKKLGPINIPSPVAAFMGRRRLVSEAIITKLRLQNQAANLAGASVSGRVMKSQIEIERRLELGPGANLDAITPLSRTIAVRYVALIAPVAIRDPDIQNQRRLDAKNDIFNQISLAAVVSAILAPVDIGAKSLYKPSNIHCVDAMSTLLFDRLNDTLRVGSSVRKEMKNQSRSISVTKSQPQCHTVKCYFDTSADGLLNVAIISIAGRLFSEIRKWFHLDSGINDYSLWVLLISKNAKNKNDKSDKENNPPNINESNESGTAIEELKENKSEE